MGTNTFKQPLKPTHCDSFLNLASRGVLCLENNRSTSFFHPFHPGMISLFVARVRFYM